MTLVMPLRQARELMQRFIRRLTPDFAVAASRYFVSAGRVSEAAEALETAAAMRAHQPSLGVTMFFDSPFHDSQPDFNLLRSLADRRREAQWFEALERHAEKMPRVMRAVQALPAFKAALSQGKAELHRRMELMSQTHPYAITALAAYPVLHGYLTWLAEHPDAVVERRETQLNALADSEIHRLGGTGSWNPKELLDWARLDHAALVAQAQVALELHDDVMPIDLQVFHSASTLFRTKKTYSDVVDLMKEHGISEKDALHLSNYLLLGYENTGFGQLIHAKYLSDLGKPR